MQDSAASLEKSMQSIEETGGDPVLFCFYKKLETEKVQKKSSLHTRTQRTRENGSTFLELIFKKKQSEGPLKDMKRN
jgi:hypothetical protein